MKQTFFLLLISVSVCLGQQSEQLIFNETTHDFGTIDENGGKADFEFTFVNNSGRTITITSVSASCGCTTPGWTKEPIENGKKGFVKASFDPMHRPGYFNKTLTVNTNLNGAPVILRIKGNVTNAVIQNDVSRFSAASGKLTMRSPEINFGKIYINKPAAIQEYIVYNASSVPIVIDTVIAPSYLKVQLPDTIPAQARSVWKLAYQASARNQFGFVSDRIEVVTNDETAPRKSFPVFATIEEYFPQLSEDELPKAPVMSVDAGAIEFGTIRMGATLERSLKFRNTGKKELIIRYVQPNCPCVTVNVSKQKLKPGEEGKITIQWTAEGKHGAQHKAITIYSTDPVSPVQRIALSASID